MGEKEYFRQRACAVGWEFENKDHSKEWQGYRQVREGVGK